MIEQDEEIELVGGGWFKVRTWPPVARGNPDQRLAADAAGRSPAGTRAPRAVRVAMMSERSANQPTHETSPAHKGRHPGASAKHISYCC